MGRILDVQGQFQTNRFGDRLIVSNVLLEVSETSKAPRGRGVLKLTGAGRVEGTTLTLDDVRKQVRGAVPKGGRSLMGRRIAALVAVVALGGAATRGSTPGPLTSGCVRPVPPRSR